MKIFVARHEYVVTQGFEAFFWFRVRWRVRRFLFEAARSDGARVFAAVAGVEHDHGTAVATAAAVLGAGGVVCDVGIGTLFRDAAVERSHHRVVGICAVRIKVDNQAVSEVADGGGAKTCGWCFV